MRLFHHLLTCAALIAIAAAPAYAVDDFRHPETGRYDIARAASKEAVRGKRYMISAANPLAVEAGAQILEEGGSAIDAAIAAQLVLNVVEPQSSGIGGGGFLLYWNAGAKELHVYDGRETAPALAHEEMFLGRDGQPLPFGEAVKGGRSVGTPGLLKMLEHAHRRHGHVEWSRLFVDAMRLSRDGFPLSPRLHELLSTTAHIRNFPASMRPYLNSSGKLKNVGQLIVNKPLYNTFATLSLKGSEPFYNGKIAAAMVSAVQDSPVNPGLLSSHDLKNYAVKEREAVCAPYREYKVCSMPPPSSGGVALLQALALLEKLSTAMDIRKFEPISLDAAHVFSEVSKLAYADRNYYLADPDFAEVPVNALLAPDYIARRAALVHSETVMAEATHGVFQPGESAVRLPAPEERPSTTHISVVDMNGNAVSMTTSIEYAFGSGLGVGGFLLNNQLTDFNFSPTLPDGKTPHPNRVEPGKRPRSSMTPVMVFDENGKLVMVIGSPGGARIIEYVLQTIIAVIDWNLDIQQAINLPHYLNMNGPTELEAGTTAAELKEGLEQRGHMVKVADTPSGLHGITRINGELAGGADPRREGTALGR